jgi:hypothetical protein
VSSALKMLLSCETAITCHITCHSLTSTTAMGAADATAALSALSSLEVEAAPLAGDVDSCSDDGDDNDEVYTDRPKLLSAYHRSLATNRLARHWHVLQQNEQNLQLRELMTILEMIEEIKKVEGDSMGDEGGGGIELGLCAG